MNREDKIKLARIVGVLLLSDGKLEDGEIDYIRRLFEELELDEDAQNEVMDRIDSGTEVLRDAADLVAHGKMLLEALEAASESDGEVSEEESDLIKMVKDVLEGRATPWLAKESE